MTKDIPLVLLCCAISVGVRDRSSAQQTPASFTIDTKLQSNLIHLGGQMMMAGRAYEYDRHLADEIGPRLTGSANYVKAADWAESEFRGMGLNNVHGEAWEMPATWEPEKTPTGRMISPHEQNLYLQSEGWSPSTPPGGVRGHVFYLDDISVDSVKGNAGKIKDNIVLIDPKSDAKHREEGYGKFFDAVNLLSSEGAKALVLGYGGPNNSANMSGNNNFIGDLDNIVTATLGLEDTLLLKRLLQKGPVEIEFSFTNRIREHVNVDNVIGEIPGRETNGEYVLIAGHLDSWQPGTGAQDDGTGAASVLAIAEAIKASGLTPRRTIRFLLSGGEEEGLLGSLGYAHEHAEDISKCVGVFVSDSGAEPPNGWYVFGRKDESDALTSLKPLLDSLGAGDQNNEGKIAFGTDAAPFLVKGVPTFVLWTPVEKYRTLHHKPSDTFDKVNQRDLNLGAAVVGITAYAFAEAPGTLKHYSVGEMETQLKEIKALTDYQDMKERNLF